MLPTLGKIVKYTLSQADVTYMLHEAGHIPDGFQVGQELPAIIVNPGCPPSTCANLHVFLDGPAWHYVVASPQGGGEGQWSDLPLS
jgi:hypothetical protein